MAPRETENNAYAKFWGDKQRALWYVMVFLEWSIVYFDRFRDTAPLKCASLSPLKAPCGKRIIMYLFLLCNRNTI